MKNDYIPPEKAKALNKILGFPPSDNPKRGSSEKIHIEDRPGLSAAVTDPKLKNFLEVASEDFDPREH